MSEQKERSVYDRQFQRLNDLNVSGFWWHGGVEWTSLIRDEIISDGNEIPQKENTQSINKPIFYSAIAILVLLFLAILTRATNTIQPVQANDKNLSQQIFFSHK